jgi:hypothetical protein
VRHCAGSAGKGLTSLGHDPRRCPAGLSIRGKKLSRFDLCCRSASVRRQASSVSLGAPRYPPILLHKERHSGYRHSRQTVPLALSSGQRSFLTKCATPTHPEVTAFSQVAGVNVRVRCVSCPPCRISAW